MTIRCKDCGCVSTVLSSGGGDCEICRHMTNHNDAIERALERLEEDFKANCCDGSFEGHQMINVEAVREWIKEQPILTDLAAEIERPWVHWVNDLQSGMYINCVYCGHRYGPKDEVPVSMADTLKEHVEKCPEHPMSRLKARLAAVRAWRDKAGFDDCGDRILDPDELDAILDGKEDDHE